MTNFIWLGNAPDQADICTVTFGGTWAAADTITHTINHNALIMTIGNVTTGADVATLFVNCWNASVRFSDATGSCNVAGQLIGEFREIIASAVGAVVTLTTRDTKDVGKPFQAYLTHAKSSASGTMGSVTSVQAATGKNWWSNIANWSGNAVPTDGNSIYLQNSAASIKYGLPVIGDNKAFFIYQYQTFTGTVGLPAVNTDNALTYAEYRPLCPVISDGGGVIGTTWYFGIGPGSGSSFQHWQYTATSTGLCAIEVSNTSGQQFGGTTGASLLIDGDAKTSLVALKGNVAITGPLAAVSVGYQGSQASDVTLTSDTSTATAWIVAGGTVTILNASGFASTITMYAGVVTVFNGAFGTVHVYGGVAFWNSGSTITTLTIEDGATLDCSTDLRAFTITNSVLNGAANLKDPFKRITYTNATTGVDLSKANWAAGPGRTVKIT